MAESICWVCANAVPSNSKGTGCSWSREFRFVEGSEYKYKRANGCDLYVMTNCPEFRLDVKGKWVNRNDDEFDLVDIENWLRIGDAAKRLGVSMTKVRKLRDQGYITSVGSRYSVEDIERVLAVFESEKDMLDTKGAAKLLGVSMSRMSSMFYENRLPHSISLRTGNVLVKKEDVLEYKAKRGCK